jgi:hypothetical protein
MAQIVRPFRTALSAQADAFLEEGRRLIARIDRALAQRPVPPARAATQAAKTARRAKPSRRRA